MNNNSKNISLEQSLQAYRVMNTPTKYSWKQHWAQEMFDLDNAMELDESDWKHFSKRLRECNISIMPSITSHNGVIATFEDLISIIIDPNNKNVDKTCRKVAYGTTNGKRPVADEAWELWNGFQVIDMDIKDEYIANKLKPIIFNKLKHCNWFLGVVTSSSKKGLHIYTKIMVSEQEQADINRKKLLYLTNFRHKYSFVYIACLSAAEELGFTKEQLIEWMDLMMFKPQQGIFISYDERPLINSKFFEDFIYVNFDNIEDLGHPDIDWITHPDLKILFKRWEWFEDDKDKVDIQVTDKPLLEFDSHNKIHYKHFERWRLANTLVNLYGESQGYQYLRMICSNNIKDKELQADCQTATRHKKPIDTWAVNRLNTQHGFKIKVSIEGESIDESEIFESMETVSNPTVIKSSAHTRVFNITKNEYLGHVRYKILDNIGRVTLLEAGAGLGKTEMVKQLVREGKKILMVMPFTSTIKSKVENDPDWYFSYGGKKPRLDISRGLATTVDKFSHLNLMDVKTAGFDYIFIDESHLLFMSEYRPVMAKVIEMIRNTEVPIILMSGTPSGELVFFPDIMHIQVIKEDVRKKEFKVNLVETSSDLMYNMCQQMARDIQSGKRILFPTNSGTLYSKQIKACVTYFMQTEHANFQDVRLHYYKKSNIGDDFMDDINFEKTIKDTQILLCTSYLSVGVDILDKYDFSIYFADLFMPQEVEQWANRLRSNDLYINLYVAKKDAEGNPRMIHKYKELNFKLNDDEIKNVHSILQLCNNMIERNPIEYRYNSLVSSIIHDNKFIEYNEVENKYYLNEIAYKVIYFERKYREYVQQLPVLMKGMQAYGYQVSSRDLKCYIPNGAEGFLDVKSMVRNAYDEQVELNTQHIEELMDEISEERLGQYKDVLRGRIDVKKGKEWKVDLTNNIMIVKNVEVFEKVIPIFLSLSKQYKVEDIKEIFEKCRNKGGSYNFAAIGRIRMLVNIIYNDKNERLDLPIKQFMIESYKFADLREVKKYELEKFLRNFAIKYAQDASTREILIERSILTMDNLVETFRKIFNCLVKTSRPKKDGTITMERIELLWSTKEDFYNDDLNKVVFTIEEFLNLC